MRSKVAASYPGSGRRRVYSQLVSSSSSFQQRVPNMRLKLAGAIVLMELERLCAGAHELSFNTLALASESPAA